MTKIVWYPIVIVLIILLIVIYSIYDNNRVKIIQQVIRIESLPKDLDGYTILQISDLHEKRFGNNQSGLINKINSVSYDTLVITGDMLVHESSKNYRPFYDMLDGISNKDTILFVPGNTDPPIYYLDKQGNYIKTDFYEGMENRGVKTLETLYSDNKGESSLHFVDFELSFQTQSYIELTKEKLVSKHSELSEVKVEKEIQSYRYVASLENIESSDVIIALTHYPVVDLRIDSIIADSQKSILNYDLIMAGHYHGGQIRLPLIGAIFVPEAWDEKKGFFPPKDRVKGLWEYRGIKQYVSAGLGSSNARPYLNFRFFNTPEINVLTLKAK